MTLAAWAGSARPNQAMIRSQRSLGSQSAATSCFFKTQCASRVLRQIVLTQLLKLPHPSSAPLRGGGGPPVGAHGKDQTHQPQDGPDVETNRPTWARQSRLLCNWGGAHPANVFEPPEQTIRNWIKQADRDDGLQPFSSVSHLLLHERHEVKCAFLYCLSRASSSRIRSF